MAISLLNVERPNDFEDVVIIDINGRSAINQS